jgi:hypothetical protein
MAAAAAATVPAAVLDAAGSGAQADGGALPAGPAGPVLSCTVNQLVLLTLAAAAAAAILAAVLIAAGPGAQAAWGALPAGPAGPHLQGAGPPQPPRLAPPGAAAALGQQHR